MTDAKIQTVAVIGATGNFGQPVARQLYKDGYEVKIITRDLNSGKTIFGSEFEFQIADALNPKSLELALQNCDAVHLNLNLDLMELDKNSPWPGYQNIVNAAQKKSVKRVTMLMGDPPLNPEDNFSCAGFNYGGAKTLSESKIPFTVFCCSWFMESLAWFIEEESAVIPGLHTEKYHWVSAQDYAQRVSKSYAIADCENKFLTVHGPEAYTITEAVVRYCHVLHPNLSVKETSISSLRKRNPTDSRWQRYLDLMESFQFHSEKGNSTEANNLHGAPATTLEQWIARQASC